MRTHSFAAFVESIRQRMGSVLTNVLVARDNNATKAYWLAKATNVPWPAPADGTVALDEDSYVPKDTVMVEVQWYELLRTEGNGDRVYGRGQRNQFPLPVRSLIATGNHNAITFCSVSGRGPGGEYVLPKAMHDKIVDYGNWDTGWAEHGDDAC